MKKTAVIIASIILFIILIGVNYLLWDNSSKKQDIASLENQEETSQQSFQSLYYENQDLKKDYQLLVDEIDALNQVITDKESEIDLLVTENNNRYVLVGDKNTIITQLKIHADAEYFKSILNEWVSNINDKAYFAAYLAHNETDIFKGRSDIYLANIGDKFENIDFMEVTEFKVRIIDGESELDQNARNRIAFDVLFNIELLKDEDGFPINDALFINGINHFKVTMEFDQNRWKWYIYTIE